MKCIVLRVEAAFHKFDTDGDGFIDWEEFKQVDFIETRKLAIQLPGKFLIGNILGPNKLPALTPLEKEKKTMKLSLQKHR